MYVGHNSPNEETSLISSANVKEKDREKRKLVKE